MGPDKDRVYPIKGNNDFQLIKNVVTRSNVSIGDYSYYDAENGESFEEQILYHYEVIGDQLKIGKFVQIGPGVQFIMNGSNHRMDGSTYPFNLLGSGWEQFSPTLDQLPYKGDTIIGNDVWIGKDAKIMPGVKVGDGVIIAAFSIVTSDIESYSIVGGNPAKSIRKRYDESTIKELLAIKWWEFDKEKLNKAIPYILNNDIEQLKEL